MKVLKRKGADNLSVFLFVYFSLLAEADHFSLDTLNLHIDQAIGAHDLQHVLLQYL